ncbi:hypothetical protein B0H14DRAFT_2654195 [Mycena olivaceomarginata]|nr:hypothetical protein B0H14DRAFT_2654195 [Mycena olivaceomarginata]
MLQIPAICLTNTRASQTQAVCTFLELAADYWKNKHRSFTYSGYLFLYWTADNWKNKHMSFTYSGYLFLYWTADYWKNKHRSFTYSGYLFLYWTADYWKNKHRSFTYSGYLFFTGRRITGKQAQELHVLRLLVLLLDGGLLNGGLTGGGFTGAQDGSKASTCLCHWFAQLLVNLTIALLGTAFLEMTTLKEAVTRVMPTLGPEGELPTSSVAPLLGQLTNALNIPTSQLSTNAPRDMGANDEDLANLINEIIDVILQDVNTTLNTLVPKLGLDGLLTPVDIAVLGSLTSLNTSFVPGLLVALQPL